MFVSKVLSGADQELDVKVWTPQGTILHHVQSSDSGGFEQEIFETGTRVARLNLLEITYLGCLRPVFGLRFC